MAVYNETFSGTQAVSGNFTVGAGSLSHVADRLVGGTGGHNTMVYTAAAVGAAQFSKILTAPGGDVADYATVTIRDSGVGGARNGFQYVSNLTNNADLQRVEGGVVSKILDMELYPHASPGDEIELQITADGLLTILIDGTPILADYDLSAHGTVFSGGPGVGTFRETPGIVSWEGGDLGGGGASFQPAWAPVTQHPIGVGVL